MAANGDLVHRAAINAIFFEGPELKRQPLGLRWTGPEVAARLSQLVLETNLLAACVSPTRIRCLIGTGHGCAGPTGLVVR